MHADTDVPPGDGTRSCITGQASAFGLRRVAGLLLDDARRRTWRNLCLRSRLYCADYVLLRLKRAVVQLLLQECAYGFVTVYADRVVVQQLLQGHKRCDERLEARILLAHILLLPVVCRHDDRVRWWSQRAGRSVVAAGSDSEAKGRIDASCRMVVRSTCMWV